jgi:two-component system, chemotaxis family, protein-glutamate methylesterase/glutaminase
MTMPPVVSIRVLVVDDSAFMRTALRRMIESDPAFKVIDTAADGIEGVEKAVQFRPDVITMDIEMPRMNGLDALSKIMQSAPCPVIMVSSFSQIGPVSKTYAEATLEALSRGAYDFLAKDVTNPSLDIVRIKDDLIAKCKAAAGQRRRPQRARAAQPGASQQPARVAPAITPVSDRRFPAPRLVCMGSSTGGPKALQQILPMLPANLAVPIVVVQHMPRGFTDPFARRLDSLCRLRVKESEPSEPLLPGVVYIARAGEQLRVVRRSGGAFTHMSLVPLNALHIPSVDILMLSAADQFGGHAMGVILTGMGHDGSRGMLAIYRAGGFTLGQDEASCTVYGMPRACAEASVLHNVLSLEAIPGEIVRVVEAASQAASPPNQANALPAG